mmetsp:Transcript_6708/g.12208  ORF Transcript_6708/g.12208 Transcript_6708/m.12208 type:complete len:366 (-) Transcript_6708:625-1722(-)
MPSQSMNFSQRKAVKIDSKETYIQLHACVDSTPLVIGHSVLSACQGGGLIKFNFQSRKIEAQRFYPGWMFQAGILLIEEQDHVVLCGHSLSKKGVLVCLTSDLKHELWKVEIDHGPVTTRPVSLDGLWVLAGTHVVRLDPLTGQEHQTILELPRACTSSPILVQQNDSTMLLAYASSDWEGGIMILNPSKPEKFDIYFDCEIGPVHKGIAQTNDSKRLFISDIYGVLHCVDLSTMQLLCSLQVSVCPLSQPTLSAGNIVVGSYDGRLHCIENGSEGGQMGRLWECDCLSSIFTKPLSLQSGDIVVCTTAGDVLRLSSNSGEIQSHHKLAGEIWSSPVEIETDPVVVGLGARDSKFHLITMDNTCK